MATTVEEERSGFLREQCKRLWESKAKLEVLFARGPIVTDAVGEIEGVYEGGFVVRGKYMQIGTGPQPQMGRTLVAYADVIRIVEPSGVSLAMGNVTGRGAG